jgi:uncharacterized protein (TIGR03437 family)
MRYWAVLFLAAGNAAAAVSLPLYFEPNEGQAAAEVRFLARGSPAVFFTCKDVVIAFTPRDVLRLSLPGATLLQPEALEPLPGISNYLNREPSITGVRHFARVRYRSVYPGIDVEYHARRSQMEYDFRVAPGARPERIRLRLQGADNLSVDRDGNLVARLRNGSFIQKKPDAWQSDGDIRRRVDVRYFLTAKNEAAFAIGAHDHTRPLIIDPLIDYVTDLGAPATDPFHPGDTGFAIAADSAGNAYITGEAASGQLPITMGTVPSATGNTGFVAKLSVDGTELVYSTYLNLPRGQAIAVDAQGSAYVAGGSGAFTGNGFFAYIVKLSPDGSAFAYNYSYSSQLGGTSFYHLVLDSANNAYASGSTYDYKFPITPSAYQPTFPGQVGLFGATTPYGVLMRLNASGGVVYATYLRDVTVSSGAQFLAVDPVAQNAIVVDVSAPAAPGQLYNASLLKLDATGSKALFTTNYQNPDPTMPILIKGIATDPSGNLYIAGDGPGFGTQVDSSAWFLALLNSSGSLVWSRHLPYFSGDLHVDGSGNAYVVANLLNTGGTSTSPAVARVSGMSSPATTIGLATTDQILASTVDPAGNIYLVLVPGGGVPIGSLPQIPATPGAFQTTGGGFAIVKLDAAGLAASPPMYFPLGIKNAASGQAVAIAPGEILSIYGTNIGPAQLVSAAFDANGNLPKSLAGTRVLIGGQPIPLLYTSASQIGGIASASLPVGMTTVQVEYQGAATLAFYQPTVRAVPGLFTADASGQGQGAIVNQDGSINSSSHPAAPGSVISIFCSGCGATNPPGLDGTIATSLAPLANPIVVTINNQVADVLYDGSAPGLVNGAVQINARIPAGITGDAVFVGISVAGSFPPSLPVTVVVH